MCVVCHVVWLYTDVDIVVMSVDMVYCSVVCGTLVCVTMFSYCVNYGLCQR